MKNIKVLLVDDDTDILEFLSYNFQKEHFVVKTVSSGSAALDLVKLYNPDVIILDLMMPGFSGDEVCLNLKKNFLTQNIPIIIITAGGNETIKKIKDMGILFYVQKPIEPNKFQKEINKCLEYHKNK